MCVQTLCVRARADVVATKLGIILLLSSFFLPLTFLRPNLRAAKGLERSGGTEIEDLVGSGRRSVCAMGK